MRQIGHLPDQKSCERLVDYLLTEGIRSNAEPDGESWSLWINNENQVDAAKEVLAHFLQAPDDARYLNRAASAKAVRVADRERRHFAKSNYHEARQIWSSGITPTARRIPITFALIAASIGVTLWSGFGSNQSVYDKFSYVKWRENGDTWNHADPMDASIDVRAGEFWRVITPAFLHLGPLHLIFNMMWLHSLGGQLEVRKGKAKYLGMVVAFAISSTVGQVFVARYPFFGGMSGVVYGLFGYIWMKARFDPRDGFVISQSTVNLMIVWFVICFMPGFGVANGGHAGGLVLGLMMGYVSSQMR